MSFASTSSKTARGKKTSATKLKKSTSSHEDIKIRLSDIGIYTRAPEEEDLVIQRDRIGYVLEKTIQRLKLAISLRQLLKHDAYILRYFAKPSDVSTIQKACTFYLNQEFQAEEELLYTDETTTTETSNTNKVKYSKENFDPDADIIQALDTLWKNRDLREKVLTDLEDTDDPTCFSFTFINAVKSIRDVAKARIDLSAAEEKSRDRSLRKAWNTQTSLQQHIDRVTSEIEAQRDTLGSEVERRRDLIEEYKTQIDYFKKKFKTETIHKVLESELNMADERKRSSNEQEELAQEAKESCRLYEALLNQHLNNEKNLRKKRLKVETQLGSWLSKYDADVGERQSVFDELTKGYQAQKAEYDQLVINFDEQEEDYVIFMAEKQEEYERVFGAKLYAFVCNRSARKIQRCWKAYRQRKRDRKAAKKKGKENKPKAEPLFLGEEFDDEPPPPEDDGGAGAKKGKDKGKGKGKSKKDKGEGGLRGADPSEALDKKFGGDVFGETQGDNFNKEEVVVEL